ncbi:MAG: ABC transporter permease [Verrucomicrobia bacterium]|nr:ABC transporter permease [Verrucomicrobiota bacterium]
MSFLPVVQRELAVNARRPATYRTRMIAAALAAGIGVLGLWVSSVGWNPGSGAALLGIEAPALLLFCLLEGARTTADCLSEEKRSGTLGLLFLTDLTGWDVVLGKLAASSLRVSFALLAVLPVAAMTLPLGGVSGAHFARLAMALGGALWISLTVGLAVSALSWDESRAFWGTLAGLGILCAGPLAVAFGAGLISPGTRWEMISVLSPLTAYAGAEDSAYAATPAAFWLSLLMCGLTGAVLVGLAAWAARRFWGGEPRGTGRRGGATASGRLPITGPWEEQPGGWLARRHWEPGRRLRLLWALAGAGGVAIAASLSPLPEAAAMFLPFVALLPFKIGLTLGTCQFFAQMREEGMLDSLRPVPTGPRSWPEQFATGTHTAWKTPFGILFGALLLVAVAVLLQQPDGRGFMIFAYLLGTEAMDLLALYWTGAWLALQSGRATAAATRALLWVHLLPSLLCCGLRLVVDLFVWAIMRERLQAGWNSAGLPQASSLDELRPGTGSPPLVNP